MIKVTVQRNLIGIEDLLVGTGTVQQVRGPAGTDPVTITEINGSNMPYDDTFSLGEKFDALQLQMDTLPVVVDEFGNLLTGLIETSALDLNLALRLWRKTIDANTVEIYYGTEHVLSYDPIVGGIIIPPDTDYIAADVVVTNAFIAADTVITDADTALRATYGDVITYDVGNTDGKVVVMTTGDKLPAVDGSNLTGLAIPEAIPIGSIFTVPYSTPDTNYLECNGTDINRTTYADLFAKIGTTFGVGDGSTTFGLPDYRGEFLRGWDNSRGVDSGRAIGTFQADEFKAHTHTDQAANNASSSGGSGTMASAGSHNTGSTGGVETRPRNSSVMYQIKALG